MFVDFDDRVELTRPLRAPFDFHAAALDGWRYTYLARSGILYPVGEQIGSIAYTNATSGDRYGYPSVEFPGGSGDGAVLTQDKVMSGDRGFSFLAVFAPAASATKYALGTFNGQTARNTQCSINAAGGLDIDWEATSNIISTADLGLRGGDICVAGFSDANGGTAFCAANGRRGGSATTGGVQGNVTAAYIARRSGTGVQQLNGGLLLWALGERVPDEHLVQLTAYPHRIFGDEPILIFPAAGGGDQTITVNDTSTGTDALSIAVAFGLADTGAGADGLAGSAALNLAETGAGADGIGLTVTFTLADSGAGTDDLSVLTETLIQLAESGSGSDAVSITASVSAAETGAGTDGLALSVSLSISDSGAGSDALEVLQATLITIAETAAGTDGIGAISVAITLPETATGVDAVAIAALVSVLETASGMDVAVVQNPDAARIVTIVFTPKTRAVEFAMRTRSITFTLN